ncbi:hypothetical protein [Alteromonas sp. A079]|uniref:hypothetical protein n=1 Tax=Alteromonas sp. A079 TaxID=3410268 RepID=UPI003B9F2D9C
MLLLSMLFAVVFVLFIYSLKKDKGRHTKFARRAHTHTSPYSINQHNFNYQQRSISATDDGTPA